jgi:hypothetical protein
MRYAVGKCAWRCHYGHEMMRGVNASKDGDEDDAVC